MALVAVQTTPSTLALASSKLQREQLGCMCKQYKLQNESTCRSENKAKQNVGKKTRRNFYHGIDIMAPFNNGTRRKRLMLMNLSSSVCARIIVRLAWSLKTCRVQNVDSLSGMGIMQVAEGPWHTRAAHTYLQ